MTLTIPTEPSVLSPEKAPPGYRIDLVWQNDARPIIRPRLQLAHTNAASTEGSIESSKRHAEAGGGNTIPQFQVDRDGDAAMLLELNRMGIHSYKANSFCIGYETADRGYLADPYPTGSPFTEPQLQMLSNGFAYCSMLYGIKLEYPTTWDGNGSACHTEPFGYDVWTKYQGKSCPGDIKKQQVVDIILPHARKIVAAWMGEPNPVPVPPPPVIELLQGEEMVIVAKEQGAATWWYSPNGGHSRVGLRNMDQARNLSKLGMIDAKTGNNVAGNWNSVQPLTVADLDRLLGPVAK